MHFIVKGKDIPIQVWTFPESSSALRVPDISGQSAHEIGSISL